MVAVPPLTLVVAEEVLASAVVLLPLTATAETVALFQMAVVAPSLVVFAVTVSLAPPMVFVSVHLWPELLLVLDETVVVCLMAAVVLTLVVPVNCQRHAEPTVFALVCQRLNKKPVPVVANVISSTMAAVV